MERYSLLFWVGLVLLFSPFLVPGQAATTTESLNISVTIVEEPTPPPPPTPPGLPWPPAPTKVIFQGKAYPNSFLTLLKDGKVTATFLVDASGLFENEITGIRGGNYNFGIWAEDTEGRRSVTLNFTLNIIEGTTTRVSGIFIPPTIEISPSQVERGQVLNIFGQSFPDSDIQVLILPLNLIDSVKTSLDGKWSYQLDTGSLVEGEYQVKARSLIDGEQSQFSQSLSFLILPMGIAECQGADLNFDGSVDIIDFSILLYFWGQTNPKNRCADINFDGIVDIFDFSIMMYWWTG